MNVSLQTFLQVGKLIKMLSTNIVECLSTNIVECLSTIFVNVCLQTFLQVGKLFKMFADKHLDVCCRHVFYVNRIPFRASRQTHFLQCF